MAKLSAGTASLPKADARELHALPLLSVVFLRKILQSRAWSPSVSDPPYRCRHWLVESPVSTCVWHWQKGRRFFVRPQETELFAAVLLFFFCKTTDRVPCGMGVDFFGGFNYAFESCSLFVA